MAYTLKPSNPVVRFAYLFQGMTPPSFRDHKWNGKDGYEYLMSYKTTSLCPLFWRCVLNLVACLGAIGVTGAAVFFLGRWLLRMTLHQWLIILSVIGGSVVILGAVWVIIYVLHQDGLNYGPKVINVLDTVAGKAGDGINHTATWLHLPLIWDMLKAVKSKMCPIVEFKE